MKKLVFLFALLFPLSLIGQSIEQADKLLTDFYERNQIAGMSVSVMQAGEILFSKGYGFADLANEIPVDPSKTKFRIGSVSKTLTAAGLARIYEQGKIDLDAPIETYVPIWPKKKYSISIRQLGGHLAGIRHYNSGEFMSRAHYDNVTDGLGIFINDPLINEPGTEYSYSSYGWNLISVAMENAAAPEASFLSHVDFLSLINQEVFEPIKMSNTQADQANKDIEHRTKFYQIKDGQLVEAPYVDNSYKWAGGGFIGTTEDLCRFGQAHMEEGYLKKETIQLWMRSQKTKNGQATNYGIGWRTFERPSGKTFYGHTGGSVGGTTYFLIHIPSQTTLAITANVDPLNYEGIPFELMELFSE